MSAEGSSGILTGGPKLPELVSNWLRGRIVAKQLLPGEYLPPESELMEQLGVSRPTLREGLRVLEAERLITLRRGARTGARVEAPSIDLSARYMGLVLQYSGATPRDIYEARIQLEPLLAAQLARNKTASAMKRLRAALADEAEVLNDPERHSHASAQFHEIVADLAGNLTLAASVRQYNWLLDRHSARIIAAREGQERSLAADNPARSHKAHVKFVELLDEGEPDTVEEFWRKHARVVAEAQLKDSELSILDLL